MTDCIYNTLVSLKDLLSNQTFWTAISALGTIGAVITSLYFARADSRQLKLERKINLKNRIMPLFRELSYQFDKDGTQSFTTKSNEATIIEIRNQFFDMKEEVGYTFSQEIGWQINSLAEVQLKVVNKLFGVEDNCRYFVTDEVNESLSIISKVMKKMDQDIQNNL